MQDDSEPQFTPDDTAIAKALLRRIGEEKSLLQGYEKRFSLWEKIGHWVGSAVVAIVISTNYVSSKTAQIDASAKDAIEMKARLDKDFGDLKTRMDKVDEWISNLREQIARKPDRSELR